MDDYKEVSIAENGNYYMRMSFNGKNLDFNKNLNYHIFHYNKLDFIIAMDSNYTFV